MDTSTAPRIITLNLSGNNLRGSVPQSLLNRKKDGLKLS
ncbi:BnaC08g47650D [Brassica napus]|uniref:BnaC08g47650D protein n=1 Tax=Brassica napus TaxID=3708 RepID=A0A078J4A0_BRANA|nr:BnaC08g47650D [Brassica napus]